MKSKPRGMQAPRGGGAREAIKVYSVEAKGYIMTTRVVKTDAVVPAGATGAGKPPIDAAAPVNTETATFALG